MVGQAAGGLRRARQGSAGSSRTAGGMPPCWTRSAPGEARALIPSRLVGVNPVIAVGAAAELAEEQPAFTSRGGATSSALSTAPPIHRFDARLASRSSGPGRAGRAGSHVLAMRWVHDLAVEMSGESRKLEMFPAQRALRNRGGARSVLCAHDRDGRRRCARECTSRTVSASINAGSGP